MTYYSERRTTQNGEAKLPVYKTGKRSEMERQYHLFCASAAINADGNDVDYVEWGTIEQGVLESKVWIAKPEPAPEPTEETPAEES